MADFIIPRREFCKGITITPQIALLFSVAGWKQSVDVVYQSAKTEKMRGILKTLLDGQHAVEVIMTHQMLKRLKEFPVVVVPEWQIIEPEIETALREYVKDGGKLLIVGATATTRFDDLLGVKQVKGVELKRTYLNLDDRFTEIDTETRTIQPLAGTTQLSHVFSLDNPDSHSEVSATIRDCGKGKIAGIYVSLGEPYLDSSSPVIRDLFSKIMTQLLPNPIVTVEGTHKVNIVPTTKNGKTLIQLINTSGDHSNGGVKGIDEIPSLYDLKVSVLTKKPTSVLLQPEGKTLTYKYVDGRAVIRIPKILIHNILEIN